MSNNTLVRLEQKQQNTLSMRDQIQIALAIADENLLKSLLVSCTPPIAQPHRIGNVTSTIGVPIATKNKAVDGIIQFESINCVLAESPAEIDPRLSEHHNRDSAQRELSSLTRCESETHILGQTITLAQALSLLAHAGFSTEQVEAILNLPYEAWHKSWWYTLDADGGFTVPFLRLIRTLRYTDGTFTIQYKDYFSQEKPNCFNSHNQSVLIEIKPELPNFRKTLAKINQARDAFGIEKALLICDSISDLEARGFISQGISIYAANETILPAQANCATCVTHDCPLNGIAESPVMTCRRFCLGE
jgi:bacterioferritin-associated ferredoxin